MANEPVHLVAVIGAGPAGLFAARALAATGARVVLLNRDIKPGGLAEYGIFLNKYKMKGGLRRQFHKILTDPLITYLGHVTISNEGDLTVPEAGRASASTRWSTRSARRAPSTWASRASGCPGVYHAKDLVYHYNRLPPFSERPFPMGRRVAIVGVGNVMVDIANYCAHFTDCDEIIAIARRGPFEKAYDDREFEDVEDAFDHALYREEIERIRPAAAWRRARTPTSCSPRSRPSPSRCPAGPRPPALPLPGLAQARGRRGRPRGRARGGGEPARAQGRPHRRGRHRRDVGDPGRHRGVRGRRPRGRGRGPALQGRALPHGARRGSRRRLPGPRSRRGDGAAGRLRGRLGAARQRRRGGPRAARRGDRDQARRRLSRGPAEAAARGGGARRSSRCAARSPSGAPRVVDYAGGAAARGGGEGARGARTRWRSSSSAATARCSTRSGARTRPRPSSSRSDAATP